MNAITDIKIGKTYLREVYSSPEKQRLLNAIEAYRKVWSNFDKFRDLSLSSSLVSYSIIEHTPTVHQTEQPEGNWDYYERDQFIANLQNLVKKIFGTDQEKAEAAYKYMLWHKGFAKENMKVLFEEHFVQFGQNGLKIRNNVENFLEKITSGRFKSVEQNPSDFHQHLKVLDEAINNVYFSEKYHQWQKELAAVRDDLENGNIQDFDLKRLENEAAELCRPKELQCLKQIIKEYQDLSTQKKKHPDTPKKIKKAKKRSCALNCKHIFKSIGRFFAKMWKRLF